MKGEAVVTGLHYNGGSPEGALVGELGVAVGGQIDAVGIRGEDIVVALTNGVWVDIGVAPHDGILSDIAEWLSDGARGVFHLLG